MPILVCSKVYVGLLAVDHQLRGKSGSERSGPSHGDPVGRICLRVNNRRWWADIQRMESPLTDQPPGFVFSSSTSPSMPQPVSMTPPDTDSPAEDHSPTPGIGPMPWMLGVLCLVVCWPVGISAMVAAGMARSADRQRVEAVQTGDLYEAARLLARSRRFRLISMSCSAAGVLVVAVLLALVYLG